MQLTEMSVVGFRTSVTVFRRPGGGLRWVIIPTVHMGHADYYWAIWQRLRSCQAVIAEIWDGPSSTGMAYANAMRLARQRASRDLVPQDIDYGALGVPVIFPDEYLAPNADPDRRMARQERLAATVMTPILALHMPTVVRELTGRLGYRVMPGARWLTAIDYDEPPHLRKPPLDGWMDW